MKSRSLPFILLIAWLLTACNSSRETVRPAREVPPEMPVSSVRFEASDKLSPALEKAAQENKLLFIDFYTTWCMPCKLMEKEVFTNEEIGAFLNGDFINLRIDAERGNGPNLATIFGVKGYPTLLFLNASGEVLVRKEGAAFHSELKKLGEKALRNGR